MAFSFSFTSPVVTAEDEERENADLDPEEKTNILNDIFGRNVEDIAEKNSCEISQDEYDAFQRALDEIPIDDRLTYLTASVRCSPYVLEKETNPALFLRRELYNPQKAAKRFVEYWNMRVELLGEDRAFLPLTLACAVQHDEEVFHAMRKFPFFRTFLPNDAHGRTVILAQTYNSDEFNKLSRDTLLKYMWYVAHLAMRRESTITKGFVLVFAQAQALKFFDRIRMKRIVKGVMNCFPIKCRAIHLCSTVSVNDLRLPVVKSFMDRDFRQRLVYHSADGHVHHPFSSTSILCDTTTTATNSKGVERFLKYGLSKEGLPPSLGGTCDVNPNWVQEELEKEEEMSLGSLD